MASATVVIPEPPAPTIDLSLSLDEAAVLLALLGRTSTNEVGDATEVLYDTLVNIRYNVDDAGKNFPVYECKVEPHESYPTVTVVKTDGVW